MNMMAQHNVNTAFVDQYGRAKRKLRISVTDRCNFKCVYCMPEHPKWMKKHELLSFEELYQFCSLMVQNGIEQIRITGGEPLMRQGVVHFIEDLQKLKTLGLKRISMTTNGHYLKCHAQALKNAGLDDLNISLDSLDPDQFKNLTQKDLQAVLEGISAAKEAGLSIKINAVLIKGVNHDQIVNLTKWAKQQQICLRFIEFMPLDGDRKWSVDQVITEQEILSELSHEFKVVKKQENSSNPARSYLIDGFEIGIISTISHSFCGSCDRVRLTAQGEFYNCLFALNGMDLKTEIRHLDMTNQGDQKKLQQQISQYIWWKDQGYAAIQKKQQSRKISMHMIGG